VKKKERIKQLEQENKELREALTKALAAIPNVNLPVPGYRPIELPFWDNGIRYC
jgi:hypothetical protein